MYKVFTAVQTNAITGSGMGFHEAGLAAASLFRLPSKKSVLISVCMRGFWYGFLSYEDDRF